MQNSWRSNNCKNVFRLVKQNRHKFTGTGQQSQEQQIQRVSSIINSPKDRGLTNDKSPAAEGKGTRTNDYCLQLVKKHDYENFLSTLLIPNASLRSGVFALRAFNCEIALIRDQITQSHIGLGRYAFWKDSVRQLFKYKSSLINDDSSQPGEATKNNLPRHPVIQELSRTLLATGNVSQKWFQTLIDSRESIMNDNQFKTLSELETYADQSVTPILYLAFEFSNVKSLNLDHCASHLGKAIGLTNFVRGLPYNTQKRRVLVPQELLIKHKISQESFIRLDEPEKIHDVIYEIASSAHLHYEKAKSLGAVIEKDLKSSQNIVNPLPILLSAVPSQIYMKKLEKFNFNPYESKLMRRNTLLPVQLYYRKFMKQYF